MTRPSGHDESLNVQAVLLVAGVADLAADTLGSVLRTVRGVLRRADGPELLTQAQQDLVARGRLVRDRYAAAPPPHLEVLARRAAARRGGADV
jgi:hypothetical protein